MRQFWQQRLGMDLLGNMDLCTHHELMLAPRGGYATPLKAAGVARATARTSKTAHEAPIQPELQEQTPWLHWPLREQSVSCWQPVGCGVRAATTPCALPWPQRTSKSKNAFGGALTFKPSTGILTPKDADGQPIQSDFAYFGKRK